MPLNIVNGDIVSMKVDAIVNATNPLLIATGGVDAAIRRAAGKELDAACRKIGRLSPGQARITDGYKLPARYVIHTVGPRWWNGRSREPEILRSCYRNALTLARKQSCRSIAFPLIASGALGVPRDQALFIAIEAIRSYPWINNLDVTLVLYPEQEFRIGSRTQDQLQEYLKNNSTLLLFEEAADQNFCNSPLPLCKPTAAPSPEDFGAYEEMPRAARHYWSSPAPKRAARPKHAAPKESAQINADLNEQLKQMDESFSQMLLRKIDESGMTDSQCYNKAGITRQHFSKIRTDSSYHPSKQTVLAFAITLQLSLSDTEEMLRKAGFTLVRNNYFDVIVLFFLEQGNYDLYTINEALYSYDQPLIGAYRPN